MFQPCRLLEVKGQKRNNEERYQNRKTVFAITATFPTPLPSRNVFEVTVICLGKQRRNALNLCFHPKPSLKLQNRNDATSTFDFQTLSLDHCTGPGGGVSRSIASTTFLCPSLSLTSSPKNRSARSLSPFTRTVSSLRLPRSLTVWSRLTRRLSAGRWSTRRTIPETRVELTCT